MDKFDLKRISVKEFANGKQFNYEVTPKKGKITINDIQKLKDNMDKKIHDSGKHSKYIVQARNIEKTWRLKGMEQDDLQIEAYEDYLSNKAKDISKFTKFDKVYFTIFTPK